MKFPKPFFRKSKNAWYLQIGKRQIALGRKREEAFQRYREISLHELGTQADSSPSSLKVEELLDLFLEWIQQNTVSYHWYQPFLQKFSDTYGHLKANDCKPFHVTRWISSQKWGATTQNKIIGMLKQAFNWATDQGLIESNPIVKMKKPRQERRERILSSEEQQLILSNISDECFKVFVTAMQETGARPGEIAKVTKDNVDLENGVWILPKHKTRKHTGKPRIIYLTTRIIEICKQLIQQYPEGVLFRNTRGLAWTKNSISLRFEKLRKKFPQLRGVISYTFRHTYTTEALENGVGVAQVAELLGHTSTDMVMQHYSHLRERQDYLRRMAEQARKPT